ncbi:MAG TPA: hypothetical protein VHO70_11340 [Chitinispirillaceae bacterium]|nr:hypothetical protein [Chitinispirillaceae bacterium]
MDDRTIPVDTPAPSIDCEVCGKKNITEEICPRCKSDLSTLWSIIRYSEHFSNLAQLALKKLDARAALAYAARSWELKNNEQAAQCAFLASCVNGDFSAATKWFRYCKQLTL